MSENKEKTTKQVKNLLEYWKQNLQENLKIISAIIFLIISKVLAIVFLGIRLGLDWLLILIMIEICLEPFIIIWLRIIFTGEVSATQTEKNLLQQQLYYQQEISEYRIQLAAIKGEVPASVMANKLWTEANKELGKINQKQVVITKQVGTMSELEAHVENLEQLSNALPGEKEKINGEIEAIKKIISEKKEL